MCALQLLSRRVRLLLNAVSAVSVLASPVSIARAQPTATPVEIGSPLRVLVGVALAEPKDPSGDLDAAQTLSQRRRIAVAQELAAEVIVRLGGRVTFRYIDIPYVAARVPVGSLAELRASSQVTTVTEDQLRRATLLRSTALLGAGLAWDIGLAGTGWTVALPDTGVDASHPFLAGGVIAEACFSSTWVGNSTQPATTSLCPAGVFRSTASGASANCDTTLLDCDHGTHVAGIVAGRAGPAGLSGIAPGATLLVMQIYSRLAGGRGIAAWDSDLLQALEHVYAVNGRHRIAAVNLSLAGESLYTDRASCDGEQPALTDAVSLLRSVGIATVASAGNDGARSALAAPACISGVISVGASCTDGPDSDFCPGGIDSIATYSNTAPFLSLLAPGSYITSSVPGSGFETLSGTSLAAPHVAGALALMKQRNPLLTVDEAIERLQRAGAPANGSVRGGAANGLTVLDLGGGVEMPDQAGVRAAARASHSNAAAMEAHALPIRGQETRKSTMQPGITRSSESSIDAGSSTAGMASTPPPDLAAIAAGGYHTCALTSAGGVKCWGDNAYGELGDGSAATQLVPVGVAGLSGGAIAVAVGSAHACALTSGGGVKCWGGGFYGQLGDGSTIDRPTPVDVVGMTSGVTAIEAGGTHTCALTSGGGVKCWGGNENGQLGDNSTTNRLTPVTVVGLSSGVAAIAAGLAHNCALTNGGAVKCWGSNAYGQLGDDSTTTNRLTPVDVSGLASGVAAIAAGGGHVCALTTSGGVKCWGFNYRGALGDNSTINRPVPVNVSGLSSGIAAIATGQFHTCALGTGGGVKCWGGNAAGQVGDNSKSNRLVPEDVVGLSIGATAISAGASHTCALVVSGGAKCWGYNLDGQLGDNSTTDRLTPVNVVGLADAGAAIAAGYGHSCALTDSGGVKCWGQNDQGQLGDNSTTNRLVAVDVTGLASGVAAIAAGGGHTCALTGVGGVKCWGYNFYGQLGDNSTTNRLAPVDVAGLSSGVAAIVAGSNHTCALTTGGGVKCWGRNFEGQLGDNSTTNRTSAVNVSGLSSGVAALAAGGTHTCALSTGGATTCWGYNGYGQLGDNSTTNRSTPVGVVGLAGGVAAIAAAGDHTCARTSGGGVKCWGDNAYGDLGDNTTTARSTPVDVIGLASGVEAITAGRYHGCALTDGGGVMCWGYNYYGQLGDNSSTNRMTPVDVIGLAGGVAAIAAGGYHSCALTTASGIRCWGYNGYGQLGDSSVLNRLTPVDAWGFEGLPDSTPDAFSFAPQTGVAQGAIVTSNSITPTGFAAVTDISVAFGSYSLGCSGSFTAAAGTISPGQSVCVRHSASLSPGSVVTTTLTIGGVPGTFSSITVGPPASPLSFIPDPLSFEGQSMFTRSLRRQVTITNVTGAPLMLNSMTTDGAFALAAQTCGMLPALLAVSGSCTAQLSFTPPDEAAFDGSLTVATSGGAATSTLVGVGERSLVVHYYGSILSRYPEASGKNYWNSEAARVQALGADLNEVWYALAMGFFNSVEYLSFNRTDGDFVDDLYRTFLNREPDTNGRNWWLGQVASGLTREVVLVAFMFSQEFRDFTASIFGSTAVRRELDAVMDFYRGLLFRLPDGGGFNFWVQRFRTAQCAGPSAVTAEAEAISGEFARGAEYASRNRTAEQYVGDLYNAILRRGGDGPGVQFWINLITSGAQTREQVRQQFVQSPEFQARVQQIIAAGCLP